MATVRAHFHYLDSHGHLHYVRDVKGIVGDSKHATCTESLCNRAFLDFFYLRLQHSDVAHVALCSKFVHDEEGGKLLLDDDTTITPQKIVDHFPYVSICGPELNFLKVEDAPVVFTGHCLDHPKFEQQTGVLTFAESLQEPLRPDALSITREGKLLHPITKLKGLIRTNSDGEEAAPLGLVAPQVGDKLGLRFNIEGYEKGGSYVIHWKGQQQVIPYAD
uniref:Uncharacterized protein n=1 Tax=Trypanosoma congolense (strain IL3000) TaxID=1068625 RepID=G0V0N8_TRYCI|nr:conserved hypothetical protein [Trypanosoma congolense IL3000]